MHFHDEFDNSQIKEVKKASSIPFISIVHIKDQEHQSNKHTDTRENDDKDEKTKVYDHQFVLYDQSVRRRLAAFKEKKHNRQAKTQ